MKEISILLRKYLLSLFLLNSATVFSQPGSPVFSVKVSLFYKYLMEGYTSDPATNFNLIVEQRGKSGYHLYSRGSLYQRLPDDNTEDNTEKVELQAKDSIVHSFHLDDAYLFVPGSYRIKCFYKNNI